MFRKDFYHKIKKSKYCSNLKNKLSYNNKINGVYVIFNTKTFNCYVGCGDVLNRWGQHISQLNRGKKGGLWQKEYDKYGLNSFDFLIIGEYSTNQMSFIEQFFIAFLNSYENGYNRDKGGTGDWKKNKYRIQKGQRQNGYIRYKLVNKESKVIFTSIYLDILEKHLFLLQNNQITEEEAINKIKEMSIKKKHIQNNQTEKALNELSIDSIIKDLTNKLDKKEISKKHNITNKQLKIFLQKMDTTWYNLKRKADYQLISEYDKKYNLKKELYKQERNKICSNIGLFFKSSLREYCKKNNISISRRNTTTGVLYLYLLNKKTWIYKNNDIQKRNKNLFVLRDEILNINPNLWIIIDDKKYHQTIKQAQKMLNIQKKNKKVYNTLYNQKRALKYFRKIFEIETEQKHKTNSSKTGITHLVFSRSNKTWRYRRGNFIIERKDINQLEKIIKESNNQEWIIEDKKLFNNVKKEVEIFYQDLKKPIEERTSHYTFI